MTHMVKENAAGENHRRHRVVEAAGRLIHLFQDGPDYAITLAQYGRQRVRSVLSIADCQWILVPALPVLLRSASL